MRNCLILITLALLATSGPFLPNHNRLFHTQAVVQSSPGSDGLLYINPSNITRLSIGSEFSISIQASGVSHFEGLDIFVHTNTSVIAPLNMSLSGDYFYVNSTGPPQVLTECINNNVTQGTGQCGQWSGPGVVELAAAFLQNPPPASSFPVYGPLFNITYKVLDPNGFSRIDFVNATLVNVQANGSHNNLNVAIENGIYGQTVPDFAVMVNPSSPVVPQGSYASTTIDLNSLDLFAGLVALNVSSPPVPGLTTSFNFTELKLNSDGTNSTALTIYADRSVSAQLYTLTLTASSGKLLHGVLLPVLVQNSPFFELQLTPAQLKIHDGYTANTTVQLQGEEGFQGNVNLTVQAPPVYGLIVLLGSANITLRPDSSVPSTLLFVTTPVVSLPFRYVINVTGMGLSNGVLVQATQTLIVKPPAASLSVSITPSNIRVVAGDSTSTTIDVLSNDYFWGFLSVSAVMAGAAVNFNSSIYYLALPNSANVTYTPTQHIGMTVNVTSNTPPGNYVALLTVYALATSYQGAFSTQIPVQVVIEAAPAHAVNTVLGLPTPEYFAILGALTIPLVFLSLLTYRRREKEDTNWRA